MLPPEKPLWESVREPKPRGWPRKTISEKPIKGHGKSSKKPWHEDFAIKENISRDELAQAIVQTKRMRIHPFYDPNSRTDLGETLGKNPLDRLVKPMQELAKSITETSSKVCETKTYDETINDPINRNKWQETIDEEFWNLNSH